MKLWELFSGADLCQCFIYLRTSKRNQIEVESFYLRLPGSSKFQLFLYSKSQMNAFAFSIFKFSFLKATKIGELTCLF